MINSVQKAFCSISYLDKTENSFIFRSDDINVSMTFERPIEIKKGLLTQNVVVKTAKPVFNMIGYLATYFCNIIELNPLFENLYVADTCVSLIDLKDTDSRTQYYFNRIPVSSNEKVCVSIDGMNLEYSLESIMKGKTPFSADSVKCIKVPSCEINGIPAYTRNQKMNEIMFHSMIPKDHKSRITECLNDVVPLADDLAALLSHIGLKGVSANALAFSARTYGQFIKGGPENIPKSKLPLITATIKLMGQNATDIVYLTKSRD